MMFWKDSLAKQILESADMSKTKLFDLQSMYPSLRVKTVDAKGKVPVIQLSEHGEWLKPKEWALNHVAALKQRYQEQHARLIDVGSDPSIICSAQCAAVSQKGVSSDDDLGEASKLRAQLERANRNYFTAMDALSALRNGKKPSLQVTEAVVQWNRGNKRFYF